MSTDDEPEMDEETRRWLNASTERAGILFNMLDKLPSPREAIIVCLAETEVALEQLISVCFRRDTSREVRDHLLGSDRPLGSLSARIDMATALGIISPEFRAILHALRSFRNDCAHSRWDELQTKLDAKFKKHKGAFEAHTPWAGLRQHVQAAYKHVENLDLHTAIFVAAWLAETLASNAGSRRALGVRGKLPGYALRPSFMIGGLPALQQSFQLHEDGDDEPFAIGGLPAAPRAVQPDDDRGESEN